LARPQSETASIDGAELVANVCKMVEQPQLIRREIPRVRRRVDVEVGERKNSRHLPVADGCFDGRSPKQIRLVRSSRSVIGHGNILVRASDLVLGAVATLREILVAANVTTFAGILSVNYKPAYTIVSTKHTSCHSPCGTWCGCVEEDHRRDQPFYKL
jgi:hypothetical protein